MFRFLMLLTVLAGPSTSAPIDEGEPPLTGLEPRDGGLTAQAVGERALLDAPDVEVRQAELEMAAARVDEARAAFFPAVDVALSYMRLSALPGGGGGGALTGTLNPGPLSVGACPDGSAGCVVDSGGVPAVSQSFQFSSIQNTYALSATLGVPVSDYIFTLPHALKAAKHGEKAARMARDVERIGAIVDAQIAYYNWVRARANLELSRRSATRVSARVDEARSRLKAGYVTPTDVLRLEGQLAAADRMVAESEAFADIAAEDLALRTQLEPGALEIGEDLTARFASARRPAQVDALVEVAQSRRLEPKLLASSDAAVREQIRVARTRYVPRLDLVGQIDTANPNQRVVPQRSQFDTTWAAGVRLSYDIRGAVTTRSALRVQRAQRRSLQAQEAGVRRSIRLQVVQSAQQLRAARRAVTYSETARKSAEAAYEQIIARYRAGAVGVIEVIEAEALRVEADLRFIDANISVREQDLRLRHAMGEVEVSSSGSPT